MRSEARRSADDTRKTRSRSVGTARESERPPASMELASFFPYRLAVLSETVSRAIASVYSARFDLSRDEWRVLAALGESGTMNTQAALLFTTLDKVQASRAVRRMEDRGLIRRERDAADRRNRILRLTPAGRALYRRIVPVVKSREAYLLQGLDEGERAALDGVIERLLARARELESR
jgi:DNA-binding MarR family transcriptional regulator